MTAARVPVIDYFLTRLLEAGGSDLHLASGVAPRIRVHGDLHPVPCDATDPDYVESCAREILSDAECARLDADLTLDFVYEMQASRGKQRFRGNAFVHRGGLNLVLRVVPAAVPSVLDLGLPPSAMALTDAVQGLLLVTGATGSGKTSTLAALIRHVSERDAVHVITIEDPIEYLHAPGRGIVIQRQVGEHVDGFQTALRSALREDPDVIVVGEMRDLETVHLALTAAETGHLVLATLHTVNAVQTVDRVVDIFPAEQQAQVRVMLSESLQGVISQQLVPRADGRGRCLATEVLGATTSVRSLVREGKTYQIFSEIQMGQAAGMHSMDASLLDLVRRGLIEPETALERAHDARGMEAALPAAASW